MKNNLRKLIILISLISCFAYSQAPSFVLTPSGFKDAKDLSKDYLIINIPEYSKKEIFAFTLKNIRKIHPTINWIQPQKKESITVKGFELEKVRRNFIHFFDIDYTITLHFMDEKIKIMAPNFELNGGSTHPQTLHLVYTKFSFDGSDLGIYGKKDKLKSKRAKLDLETYFNRFIEAYITSLK